MTQAERAKTFRSLHIEGDPLILFNVWDAGAAKRAAELGSAAIATGSRSVAYAHGYDDGEQLPLDLAIANIERIVKAVGDLPVSMDFEGAYSADPEGVAQNLGDVIEAGVIGCNFEDQVVGADRLYATGDQCARIAAARKAAMGAVPDFYINARTDVFLKTMNMGHDDSHVDEAIARGKAYADAGASGFFIPGLRDLAGIERIVKAVPLPINVMMMEGLKIRPLAEIGVARISYGPGPYYVAMEAFQRKAREALEA